MSAGDAIPGDPLLLRNTYLGTFVTTLRIHRPPLITTDYDLPFLTFTYLSPSFFLRICLLFSALHQSLLILDLLCLH